LEDPRHQKQPADGVTRPLPGDQHAGDGAGQPDHRIREHEGVPDAGEVQADDQRADKASRDLDDGKAETGERDDRAPPCATVLVAAGHAHIMGAALPRCPGWISWHRQETARLTRALLLSRRVGETGRY
jgi:hypothetical protein